MTIPSFPHAFSGNPGGIRTAPPIKAFRGDDLGTRASSADPTFEGGREVHEAQKGNSFSLPQTRQGAKRKIRKSDLDLFAPLRELTSILNSASAAGMTKILWLPCSSVGGRSMLRPYNFLCALCAFVVRIFFFRTLRSPPVSAVNPEIRRHSCPDCGSFRFPKSL